MKNRWTAFVEIDGREYSVGSETTKVAAEKKATDYAVDYMAKHGNCLVILDARRTGVRIAK